MCSLAALRFIFYALCKESFAERFRRSVSKLALEERNRIIIEQRYVQDLEKYESKFFHIGGWYFILTNYITIGGVLVTSFLTLQKLSIISEAVNNVFFWLSWVMSVLVTVANKTMHSFNIYTRYEFVKKRVKKYRSEGWRFVSRISAYEDCENDDEAFILFMQRLDKIDSQTIKVTGHKTDVHGYHPFGTSSIKGDSQGVAEPASSADAVGEPTVDTSVEPELPRVTDIKRLSQRITGQIPGLNLAGSDGTGDGKAGDGKAGARTSMPTLGLPISLPPLNIPDIAIQIQTDTPNK